MNNSIGFSRTYWPDGDLFPVSHSPTFETRATTIARPRSQGLLPRSQWWNGRLKSMNSADWKFNHWWDEESQMRANCWSKELWWTPSHLQSNLISSEVKWFCFVISVRSQKEKVKECKALHQFKVADTMLNEWMNEWKNQRVEKLMNPAINQDINHSTYQSTITTCSQSIIQVNQAINQSANLSVNQSTNQCINRATNHTSKPSTNLSVNSLIIKNYQSIKIIINHFTNQLCHSSIKPQSRQKELTLCQVIWS